jgi:hypothetical protein
MTAAAAPSPALRSTADLLRRAWTFSPLLTLAGLACLALVPLFIVAGLADPRIINGAPAWTKPLKFALSITIFSATFIWLLTFVDRPDEPQPSAVARPSRRVRWIAGVTGFALLVEMALISLQVLRNTGSHFNAATPFDLAVFSIMGSLITAVSVCTLILAIWLIRRRLLDSVFAWGLRLGVLLSVAGMMVAFLMTTPTAAQLEAARAGAGMAIIGAHSVGVDDGGPGLPILGWSTVGGDLRVPHFFGLHAMQVLPLIGGLLTLSAARRRWSDRGRLALVWTAGLGYLAMFLLLTWQALRGQSIVAPDGITLAAAALLILGLAAAVAVITRREGVAATRLPRSRPRGSRRM